MLVTCCPKDNEARTLTVSRELIDLLAERVTALGLQRQDLLFPSTDTRGAATQP